jgi:hypothetical protein
VAAVSQRSTGSGSRAMNRIRGAWSASSRCSADSSDSSSFGPCGCPTTNSFAATASNGPGCQPSSIAGHSVVAAGWSVQNGAWNICAGRTSAYASGEWATTLWVSWLPSRLPLASLPRYTPRAVARQPSQACAKEGG